MNWRVLLVSLCVWIPQDSVAASHVFRIGVPWALGSKGMNDLQAAGREIAEKTAGRVQVKFVEQLDLESGPAPCDGALLAGPALACHSPASRIFALPLLFRTSAEVAQLRMLMAAHIAAELAARGLATLAQLDLGFAYLHSRAPIETVAQFKAAKLWVPPTESEALRMAETYGLTLVPLDAAQVREALRQGTVDAALAPPLGAIVLQWHTEIKSVMEAPFLCVYGAVVVQTDALAGLEVADRALLCDELTRAFSGAADDLRKKEPEAFDVLVQNGVAPHPLGGTPEEQAEWTTWATAVADQLVADDFISAEILTQARQMLAGFRATP